MDSHKSKKETILDYFTSHPDMVLGPSDVAGALSYDEGTTNTTMARLVDDGALVKVGKGRYQYKTTIDHDSAVKLYKHLYRVVGESIGLQIAQNILKITDETFDEEKPIESICTLINAMKMGFGEKMVNNVVNTSIMREFGDEKGKVILVEITKAT